MEQDNLLRRIEEEDYTVPEGMRTGLRLRFDKGIDENVKRSLKDFCVWMRRHYNFPIRVPVYVKNKGIIKAMDGDEVYGTFFEPYYRDTEPYIRIAAGDYKELKEELGRDGALAEFIYELIHEITHYWQWICEMKLTEEQEEAQAEKYEDLIMDLYAEGKEHL